MINLEARSVKNWSSGRHCVVARLDHLTSTTLVKIKESAGALLIVLPRSPQHLSLEEVKELTRVLTVLTAEELSLPVYLIGWSAEVEKILDEVMGSLDEEGPGARSSGMDALAAIFSKNGYQVVVSAPRPAPRNDAAVTSIQGKLAGYGVEDKLPTIVIVAYYDAQSIAPELSFGAESNASGVVMLLELARLLSLLYSNSRTHGHVNIVFLISGGGSLNYQGSKKWLEDQLESVDSTLLQDVQFVLCLDSVAQPLLNMHVSKPPRERSPLNNFYTELLNATGNNIEIIHKKINLADDILAWEHERYSIRRLPATTISSLKSHRELRKDGLFDVAERVDIKSLTKNIENIASALIRHIYNITRDPSTFSQQYLGIYEDQVKMWLDFLSSHARSPSVMYEKTNPVIRVLHESLKRYSEDAKIVHHTADKRDPEFVFYDTTKANINIYNVKPAIFDLFLTILISLYLAAFFIAVQKMHLLYGALVPSGMRKLKTQ
ncbi:BOS complex subunit NCLN isoform X2 [Rhodnius prolixus]